TALLCWRLISGGPPQLSGRDHDKWLGSATGGSSRAPRPSTPQLDQRIGYLVGAHVLPEVHRCPSHGDQLLVLPDVPHSVLGALFYPPLPVVLGKDAVLGATVPETAVNEHGDACFRQHNVRRAGEVAPVHPEAETPGVKGSSDGQLGLGRRTWHAAHLL